MSADILPDGCDTNPRSGLGRREVMVETADKQHLGALAGSASDEAHSARDRAAGRCTHSVATGSAISAWCSAAGPRPKTRVAEPASATLRRGLGNLSGLGRRALRLSGLADTEAWP